MNEGRNSTHGIHRRVTNGRRMDFDPLPCPPGTGVTSAGVGKACPEDAQSGRNGMSIMIDEASSHTFSSDPAPISLACRSAAWWQSAKSPHVCASHRDRCKPGYTMHLRIVIPRNAILRYKARRHLGKVVRQGGNSLSKTCHRVVAMIRELAALSCVARCLLRLPVLTL